MLPDEPTWSWWKWSASQRCGRSTPLFLFFRCTNRWRMSLDVRIPVGNRCSQRGLTGSKKQLQWDEKGLSFKREIPSASHVSSKIVSEESVYNYSFKASGFSRFPRAKNFVISYNHCITLMSICVKNGIKSLLLNWHLFLH